MNILDAEAILDTSRRLNSMGGDSLLTLRRELAIHNRKTRGLVSCISCKYQNECRAKAVIKDAIQQTGRMKKFKNCSPEFDLFTFFGQCCTEFEQIDDAVFRR